MDTCSLQKQQPCHFDAVGLHLIGCKNEFVDLVDGLLRRSRELVEENKKLHESVVEARGRVVHLGQLLTSTGLSCKNKQNELSSIIDTHDHRCFSEVASCAVALQILLHCEETNRATIELFFDDSFAMLLEMGNMQKNFKINQKKIFSPPSCDGGADKKDHNPTLYNGNDKTRTFHQPEKKIFREVHVTSNTEINSSKLNSKQNTIARKNCLQVSSIQTQGATRFFSSDAECGKETNNNRRGLSRSPSRFVPMPIFSPSPVHKNEMVSSPLLSKVQKSSCSQIFRKDTNAAVTASSLVDSLLYKGRVPPPPKNITVPKSNADITDEQHGLSNEYLKETPYSKNTTSHRYGQLKPDKGSKKIAIH